MSTDTTTHTEEHGMSNAGYVRIALILAAITALDLPRTTSTSVACSCQH